MSVGLNAQGVQMEQAYGRPLMASFHASFSLGGLAGAVLGGLLAWLEAGPGRGPRHYRWRRGDRADRRALAARRARRWAARPLTGPPAPLGRAGARPADPAATRHAGAAIRLWRGEGRSWRGPGAPRLIGLGLLALCSLIAEGAAANWSGLYLRDNLGAQRGIAAAGFAAFSLAMAGGAAGR